jgi:hypothetical protein
VNIFGAVQTIQQQRRILKDVHEGKYESKLLDVLARFQYVDAMDPRDLIYGLLGLVSERHTIRVDYSKPAQEVFADTTRFFINTSANLDILCQNPWPARCEGGEKMIDGLPSWVVDFTHEKRASYFERSLEGMLFAQRGIFNAGPSACLIPCEVSQNRLLHLHGVMLDHVHLVDEVDYNQFGYLGSWLQNMMPRHFGANVRVEDESTTYPVTGEPLFRAYWRTVVMDCKAHPIQRLSQEDVEVDEKIFKKLLQHDPSQKGPNEYDLVSYRMWSRSQRYWVFAKSKKGLLLMVPKDTQVGDVIAILDGGKVPCLLRPVGASNELRYRWVNTVYVHGYMDGKAATEVEQGRLERCKITLE